LWCPSGEVFLQGVGGGGRRLLRCGRLCEGRLCEGTDRDGYMQARCGLSGKQSLATLVSAVPPCLGLADSCRLLSASSSRWPAADRPFPVHRGTPGPLAGGVAHHASTHWQPNSHKSAQGPLAAFPFPLPPEYDAALQQQYGVVTELRSKIKGSGLDEGRRTALQVRVCFLGNRLCSRGRWWCLQGGGGGCKSLSSSLGC
jgi:hypothetical protein